MLKKTFCITLIIALLSLGQAYSEEAVDPNNISLDFKGMDVVDVLKLLAQRGNMNIAISKNVRGKVTMFLKDVDVNDAFEIILATNDLAYEKKGNIINVMTEKDYEQTYGSKFHDKRVIETFELKYVKAADVSKALEQIKTKIGKVIVDEGSNAVVVMDAPFVVERAKDMILTLDKPVETRVFTLDYAKAEEVKSKIEEKLTKNIGLIQVDERTNKLLITELSSRMSYMEELIGELDERTREVLIEAKIVEVTLNDEFKWGINWDQLIKVSSRLAGMSVGANFADAIVGSVIPAETGSVTGGSFEIGTLTGHKYHAMLEVLETVGKTEVLSSPRIVVINNEEASILVGTNQPYATTGTTVSETVSQTTQQVTYVDLGIKLHVTPTINKRGYITMKIKPEVSSKTGDVDIVSEEGDTIRTTKVPIIQTSEAETTVMVKDGNTIVLAGLIEKRSVKTENSIPFLSKIPLIGFLFKGIEKGDTDNPERKELVIFLTPHIISGDVRAPEVNDYLTTTEVGKAEVVQPSEKKRERTHFKEWGGSAQEEYIYEPPAVKAAVVPIAARGGELYYSTMSPSNYYNFVRDKVLMEVRNNYPRSGIAGDVYISFKVIRDGTLVGEPRILATADESLKDITVRSVKNAAPFPEFPESMRSPVETFKIVVSYR
ncbi:MAG: secretin and TonB N-terminal domain-containing protein [Candidatus Omnitrophica bacterium]|nr:secretin and TonB N-terminal domain-containing protein [Candidatus Omnitrophota bacterium]